MGVTINLVSVIALILGVQLINIYTVTAAPVDVHGFMKITDYDPPNQGGPDSSQGSGTR